jgi:hypothetical protein
MDGEVSMLPDERQDVSSQEQGGPAHDDRSELIFRISGPQARGLLQAEDDQEARPPGRPRPGARAVWCFWS